MVSPFYPNWAHWWAPHWMPNISYAIMLFIDYASSLLPTLWCNQTVPHCCTPDTFLDHYVFGTLISNDYLNTDINFSIINLIKIILNGGQESSEESVFTQDKGQHIPDTGLCEISEGNSDRLEYEIYEYCYKFLFNIFQCSWPQVTKSPEKSNFRQRELTHLLKLSSTEYRKERWRQDYRRWLLLESL